MASNRLRYRIWYWLTETQFNRTLYVKGDKGAAIVRLQEMLIERPGTRLLCLFTGHQVIADNCGMADHDYCVSCGRLMPGQAERRR